MIGRHLEQVRAGLRVITMGGILATAGLCGCSMSTRQFSTPSPAEIPSLEAITLQDHTDVDAITALAAGYVSEGRLGEALQLLERASERLLADPTVLVMLGLVEEELGLDERAAQHLSAYLDMSRGPPSVDVAARLDAVRGAAMRAQGARLLDRADSAQIITSDPERIVVAPFSHVPEDAHLAIGLTWLVSRSLSHRRLEVVDRVTVQALLEEMSAEPVEWSGLAVGLDLARLFGAGHVIQGALTRGGQGAVVWELTVLTLGREGPVALSFIPAEGVPDELPEVAARVGAIARRLVEGLDSIAPQRDIDVPAPSEVQALLAFARGMQSVDSGDWRSARLEFETARGLDGSFNEASDWARRAEAVLLTDEQPLLAALEAAVRVGERRRAVVALRSGPGSIHQQALSRVGARSRAEVSELLGLDRVGGGGLLRLIFDTSVGGGP